MTREQFTPQAWRQKKYPDKQLEYLTSNLYQWRLGKIESEINNTILEAQVEHEEIFSANYCIVGVVIFGSWVRGDVHRESDLDIYGLARRKDYDLWIDFRDRLRRNGIGIQIDYMGNIIFTDSKESRRYFSGRHEMLGENYRIVTPYTYVREQINQQNKE